MNYSYSRLKAYFNCPRRYHEEQPGLPPHPAATRGVAIHAQLEEAVKTGQPPADVWVPPGLLERLTQHADVELKLAIGQDYTPCDFDDPDRLLRGILDVLILGGRQALTLDWKTGKFYPDPLQADVYATLLRAHHGSDLQVSFGWVYVDLERVKVEEVDTRAEERVREAIATVEADEDFDPRPSGLCKFCPVFQCEYNRSA